MTPASFALALDDWAQKSMNARMEWRFAQYERRSVCGIQGPLTRQLKKVVMPTTIERRCSVVMSGGSVRRCREIHGQQKGTAPAALGAVPGASLLQAGVNLTEDLADLGA
jgi:hypothetical protein